MRPARSAHVWMAIALTLALAAYSSPGIRPRYRRCSGVRTDSGRCSSACCSVLRSR